MVRAGLLAGLLAVTCTASAAAATPHLALDQRWIARSTAHASLVTPRKLGMVVSSRGDRVDQPYVTVLSDHDHDRWRLWYDASTRNHDTNVLREIASRDGLHFHAAVTTNASPLKFGASIVPTAHGYRAAWFGPDPHGGPDGIWLADSRDGIHWKTEGDRPTLAGNGVSDIVSLFHFGACDFLYFKEFSTPADPWRPLRRVVDESRDCGSGWSSPQRLFAPGSGDPADVQFYGLGGIENRGDFLVGFVRVLRPDIDQGIGYTELAWSADGVHWIRSRRPFLRRSASAGAWDAAMAWADEQQPDGNRVLIYYGGYAVGHHVAVDTGRAIGAATLPLDRYAGLTGGVVQARRMWLRGLELNARGRIAFSVGRVQCTTDADGVHLHPACDGHLPDVGAPRFDVRHGTLFALYTH